MHFIYKKWGNVFLSIVSEISTLFFLIYNKFVKIIRDLANILITLKILILKN
jgi:hypothetical protein